MSCTQFSVLLLRPDVSNVINTSRCPSLSVCFSPPHPLSVFCSLSSRILSGDWQPDCVFESPSNCQWVFIPLILYSYQFVNVSFLRSLFYLHFHFAFQSLQVKDAVFSASFSNDQMRQLYRFYITVDCSKSFISFAYDKDFFPIFSEHSTGKILCILVCWKKNLVFHFHMQTIHSLHVERNRNTKKAGRIR